MMVARGQGSFATCNAGCSGMLSLAAEISKEAQVMTPLEMIILMVSIEIAL